MSKVTFCHQTANSTCHLQEPGGSKDAPNPITTAVFSGKPGGQGFYETDVPWQIAELTKLANNPQVQITRIDAELAAATDEVVAPKAADPALQAASNEVLTQAANAADPKLVAVQDNLAALLAAGSQKTTS